MSEWIDGPPPLNEDKMFPAGVLLEFADGRRNLIGHVNQMNGLCNDCSDDEHDMENAVRHMVVWTP